MAEGSHLVTTCVVVAGVGKEGLREPSLLGRNLCIEIATKQQNVRNSLNKKIWGKGFLKPKSSHNFTEIGFKTKISSL